MSARSDGPPWKWEVASSNLATQTNLIKVLLGKESNYITGI